MRRAAKGRKRGRYRVVCTGKRSRDTPAHAKKSPPILIRIHGHQDPVPSPSQSRLYPQHRLRALVGVEADGGHGDDLDVSDREADEEPGDAALSEDHAGRLGDAQPVPVADGAGDLHAPPDDLERVRDGLRDGAGDAARGELGPRPQRRRLVGRRVGGLGERRVFPEQRGPEDVAYRVVRQERHAGVRNHAEEGGGEAPVEVDDARAWSHGLGRRRSHPGGAADDGRSRVDGGRRGFGKLVFVVNLPADVGQRGAPNSGLER